MKKITAIFLFLLMGLSGIAWYPMLRLAQFHAKELAKGAIKKQRRENYIVFTNVHENKEIEWENAGEFRYGGKMYDIAKEETHNGTHLCYCYDDRNESRVSDCIETLIHDSSFDLNDYKANKALLQLVSLLGQIFIPVVALCIDKPVFMDNPVSLSSYVVIKCLPPGIEVPLPPPWLPSI